MGCARVNCCCGGGGGDNLGVQGAQVAEPSKAKAFLVLNMQSAKILIEVLTDYVFPCCRWQKNLS